jgi:P27 family predicted phage terminase small subunit
MVRGTVPKGDKAKGHKPAVGEGKLERPATLPDKMQELATIAESGAAIASVESPPFATAYAVELWRVCVVEMAANKHLHEPDLAMLRAYVDQCEVHELASADVRERGVLLKIDVYDAEGNVVGSKYAPNPAVKMARDAATSMRLLSDVLGLNPLARVRSNLMDAAAGDMVGSLRDRLLKQLQDRAK